MTKLSEAIKRTARVEAPQIGFSPTPSKPRGTMLLVALVNREPHKDAAAADVVLVQGAIEAAMSNGSQEPALRGAWLEDAADATDARQKGFDFVVFNANETPASLLLEEDAGLVMQVQEELSDSLLQALQWLPLDALLVRWDGTLTVRRQLELQRLSGFSRKPLFLFVDGELQAGELEALREAGVIGIVVDLQSSGGAERLKTLRERIDGLRPRPKRSRGEGAVVSATPALLPVAAEPEHTDDDDDDE
jgi:hypothetical protein